MRRRRCTELTNRAYSGPSTNTPTNRSTAPSHDQPDAGAAEEPGEQRRRGRGPERAADDRARPAPVDRSLDGDVAKRGDRRHAAPLAAPGTIAENSVTMMPTTHADDDRVGRHDGPRSREVDADRLHDGPQADRRARCRRGPRLADATTPTTIDSPTHRREYLARARPDRAQQRHLARCAARRRSRTCCR